MEGEQADMEPYVIGMDGGGTKTDVVLLDLSGKTLANYTAGPMNYNGVSPETVEASIHRIFYEVQTQYPLENCISLCVASAGIGNPEARARLEQQIRKCGYTAALQLAGDEQAALSGALNGQCGMILIAGTGSICCGKNEKGESCRSGGYGHRIDDEGSGYAIGRDILSAVIRAGDGRDGPTLLTDFLRTQASLTSDKEIVQFVYSVNTSKNDIAALAKFLPDACREGDAAALKIAEKSAESLAELPVPVAKRLGLSHGKLALCGSILQKDPWIRALSLSRIHRVLPGVECIAPLRDAATGAALMALDALPPRR